MHVPPVPHGPVAYRARLLRFGPVAGLALPVAVGAVAIGLLRVWPCDGVDCVDPAIVGWFFFLLAVPFAVPLGMPLAFTPARMLISIVLSAVLWAVLGRWAARRATKRVVAGWSEWWKEYALLAAAVWAGELVGLGVTGLVMLGR